VLITILNLVFTALYLVLPGSLGATEAAFRAGRDMRTLDILAFGSLQGEIEECG
jgi:hypothetical protein